MLKKIFLCLLVLSNLVAFILRDQPSYDEDGYAFSESAFWYFLLISLAINGVLLYTVRNKNNSKIGIAVLLTALHCNTLYHIEDFFLIFFLFPFTAGLQIAWAILANLPKPILKKILLCLLVLSNLVALLLRTPYNYFYFYYGGHYTGFTFTESDFWFYLLISLAINGVMILAVRNKNNLKVGIGVLLTILHCIALYYIEEGFLVFYAFQLTAGLQIVWATLVHFSGKGQITPDA